MRTVGTQEYPVAETLLLLETPGDDLLDGIFNILVNAAIWHDITGEEGSDPEAAQSLACGFDTKAGSIFILSRYEDEGQPFVLVGSKHGDPFQKVTDDLVCLQFTHV